MIVVTLLFLTGESSILNKCYDFLLFYGPSYANVKFYYFNSHVYAPLFHFYKIYFLRQTPRSHEKIEKFEENIFESRHKL